MKFVSVQLRSRPLSSTTVPLIPPLFDCAAEAEAQAGESDRHDAKHALHGCFRIRCMIAAKESAWRVNSSA